MFETTAVDAPPFTVRLSFWQWMKAGMGFTLGAALVSVVAFALSLMVPGAFLYLFSVLLHRLR